MTKGSSSFVSDYLSDLDAALRALPSGRRREIVEQVEGHLREKLAALGDDPNEAAVRQAIEEMGDPEAIAIEAMERFDVQPVRAGLLEVAALILLQIGAFIIPIVGWIIGVVLLWMSRVWSTRDKLLGTLVVPGGLFSFVYLGFFFSFASSAGSSCSTSGLSLRLDGRSVSRTPMTECESYSSFPFPPQVMFAILLAFVVASVGVAIYLAMKAARSRRVVMPGTVSQGT